MPQQQAFRRDLPWAKAARQLAVERARFLRIYLVLDHNVRAKRLLVLAGKHRQPRSPERRVQPVKLRRAHRVGDPAPQAHQVMHLQRERRTARDFALDHVADGGFVFTRQGVEERDMRGNPVQARRKVLLALRVEASLRKGVHAEREDQRAWRRSRSSRPFRVRHLRWDAAAGRGKLTCSRVRCSCALL